MHEGPRWRRGFNDTVSEKIRVLNMELQLRGLVLFCFVCFYGSQNTRLMQMKHSYD